MKILRNLSIIACSPLIICISVICFILIYLEDGSPVIFTQKRLGVDKNIFKIFKIRTMRNNADQVGTHEIDEDMILASGKIIRKLKLDEFLQLINVLKGDLNLIGPRPGLPSQLELKNARDRRNIFNIKPGITGLAQVTGFDMQNPEELSKVDQIYASKKSIILDFKILVCTLTRVFKVNLIEFVEKHLGLIDINR
jgi:lipopolysaccharide/colanic/teichoic acid biosynthesis glycosyltransferase